MSCLVKFWTIVLLFIPLGTQQLTSGPIIRVPKSQFERQKEAALDALVIKEWLLITPSQEQTTLSFYSHDEQFDPAECVLAQYFCSTPDMLTALTLYPRYVNTPDATLAGAPNAMVKAALLKMHELSQPAQLIIIRDYSSLSHSNQERIEAIVTKVFAPYCKHSIMIEMPE